MRTDTIDMTATNFFLFSSFPVYLLIVAPTTFDNNHVSFFVYVLSQPLTLALNVWLLGFTRKKQDERNCLKNQHSSIVHFLGIAFADACKQYE